MEIFCLQFYSETTLLQVTRRFHGSGDCGPLDYHTVSAFGEPRVATGSYNGCINTQKKVISTFKIKCIPHLINCSNPTMHSNGPSLVVNFGSRKNYLGAPRKQFSSTNVTTLGDNPSPHKKWRNLKNAIPTLIAFTDGMNPSKGVKSDLPKKTKDCCVYPSIQTLPKFNHIL